MLSLETSAENVFFRTMFYLKSRSQTSDPDCEVVIKIAQIKYRAQERAMEIN